MPGWGDALHDALEDRLALPTGRYRFTVEGTGYRVQSRAFAAVDAAGRAVVELGTDAARWPTL